jgi:membrane-associated phospholipid phosphatase
MDDLWVFRYDYGESGCLSERTLETQLSVVALEQGLTDLGDLAVLLPVALSIFVWLAASAAWRPAAAWILALGICIAGTGVLKVLFFVCPPAASLHSPSGHTSLSTLVYGGLALLLAARGNQFQRAAAVIAGFSLVAAIAVTRVALNSHTVLETVIGVVVGALALVAFGAGYFARGGTMAPLRPLILTIAIVLIALHGQQLHAEELLRAIGEHLRTEGLACR